MVRKASDKTLWSMSVNQIENRIDRLHKEAGKTFKKIQRFKRLKKTKTKGYKKLTDRQNTISRELKRTTDIAKITRHHSRLRKQRKRRK